MAYGKLLHRHERVVPNNVTIPRQPIFVALATAAVAGALFFGLAELDAQIRIAFITFAVAIIGWVFTRIEDSYVALAAAMIFVLAGIEAPDEFFEALGDNLVWLLVSSFIIAAAVKASGLSNRLAMVVAARARSVGHIFYALTAVVVVTAFLIPATTGRAALMVPVFLALSNVICNPRIIRALALLFPTVILLSAFASLIGAGAHLLAADIIWRMTGERIDFLRWMMLGLPFALISSFLSTWVILRLFLTADERRQPLALDATTLAKRQDNPRTEKLSGREYYVMAVAFVVVLLWCTEPLHGLNNTVVAIFGALAVTLHHVGPISLKQGINNVEWNLIVFMVATLELSEGLVDSGAAKWLVDGLFSSIQGVADSAWLVFGSVMLIALLSHLVIASRSARVAILVPMVILLALALGYNAVALSFVAVAATGFCVTLAVSAKPVAMFSQLPVPTYAPRDLLRLSGVLLPLHLVLIVVFTVAVWPHMGLSIMHETPAAPPAPHWQQPWEHEQANPTPTIKNGYLLDS